MAISRHGDVLTGARAIYAVLSATTGPWRRPAIVMRTRPLSMLSEPLYRVFARHRGRLARFFKDPEPG